MDWVAITKATRAAFGQSVNDWIIASVRAGRLGSRTKRGAHTGLTQEQR